MAIQAFGQKIKEDAKSVYYNFGGQSDELLGEAVIAKDTFELNIIKDLDGKNGTYLMCKLASKIVKEYKHSNEFPQKISSQS